MQKIEIKFAYLTNYLYFCTTKPKSLTMELRQLRYFLRTAECLSFTEAAHVLCITQPTLSQQIRQLEQELGVTLFERNSHSVCLTDAGRQLVHTAERTLLAAEECRQQMQDLKSELRGTVRVGVTESCASILRQPVRDFIKKYPRVCVQVHYTGTHSMQEMLYRHQLDFAMAFCPQVDDPELNTEPLFDDHLSAIMSRTHALANRTELSLTDIPESSLVLPSSDMHARKAIDSFLREAGVSIQPRLEVNDAAYMLDIVSHSGLVTLQAAITATGRDNLVAIPIRECSRVLRAAIFTPRETYVRRAARTLIALIHDQMAVHRFAAG